MSHVPALATGPTALAQRAGAATRVDGAPPPPPAHHSSELGAWIGGSYAWGLITGLITKGSVRSKVGPIALVGTITAVAAVGRLGARTVVPADGPAPVILTSGVGRGALTGAAVGATMAAQGGAGAGRIIGRGAIVGAVVGLGIGAIESATDTYIL